MAQKRELAEAQQPERKRCRTQHEDDAQSIHSLESLIGTTIDFHEIWRGLKAAGWTCVPPHGSDSRYRYVLPGCSADGRYGQDFLLGEEAVVRHYMEHRNPGASGCSGDEVSRRQLASARAAGVAPASLGDRINFAVRGGAKLDNAGTSRGCGGTSQTLPSNDFATANVFCQQTTECKAISSRQMFKGKGRKKRVCVVCRFEGRYPTEVTDYCQAHSVCLCTLVHGDAKTPFTCPQSTWTCWEKFHRFYLPNGVFNAKGNIRRSSRLATLWAQHRRDASQDTSETEKEASTADKILLYL